jgi:hypothetical protein
MSSSCFPARFTGDFDDLDQHRSVQRYPMAIIEFTKSACDGQNNERLILIFERRRLTLVVGAILV